MRSKDDLERAITRGARAAAVRHSAGHHGEARKIETKVDQLRQELAEIDRPTLEACVCGCCTECPDGWHWGEDLPCSCTPDCALDDEAVPA